MYVAALWLCLLCPTNPAAANRQAAAPGNAPPERQAAAPPEVSEAFRIRIRNTAQGEVEISTDRGKRWSLVARVTQPAVSTAVDTGDGLPTVRRSNVQGLAFGVGRKGIVRFLPDAPAVRRDRAAILVNVPPTFALFKDFLPPVGAPVQQEVNRTVSSLPPDYLPQDGDILVLAVPRSDIPTDKLPVYVKDAAERYQDDALSRLRAQGKKPTSGALTVTARLAQDETPSAVIFLLDGTINAILNRPPYNVRWDTRDWPNGEHLIEVRALDKTGTVLTQTKALVVVQNDAER